MFPWLTWPKKPYTFNFYRNAEKVRKLHIEKSSYPLGIQISQGSAGGIFVTTVTEGSIAQKAGLRYGDQILEVCLFP